METGKDLSLCLSLSLFPPFHHTLRSFFSPFPPDDTKKGLCGAELKVQSRKAIWYSRQVSFENEDRSTKHPNLENEAPKTRKRSTQDSKTKHPKLENEAPKSRNHCMLKDNNFKSCMTQAKPGGGNGCVRTSKGPPIRRTEHLISRLQR